MNARQSLFFALTAGACLLLFVLNIIFGSVLFSCEQLWAVFSGRETGMPAQIIFNFRLPGALTALLAGACLSAAGLQMQTLFRNPLAGPSVLGITAGAGLGVAFVVLGVGTASWTQMPAGWQISAAGAGGAFAVMLLIAVLAGKLQEPTSLLIVGLMIAHLTTAVVSVWQYFSSPEQIRDFLLWTFGSLSGVAPEDLPLFTGFCIAGLLGSMLISKQLNGLLLGENYARSAGMSVRTARVSIILATCVPVGCITAFCGPIGFVGLAVPHLARGLFRTSDHRMLLPACMLLGAALLSACDLAAKLPGFGIALPINAVTSLLGAPVVIAVLLRRR